jgi:hypothetical protein
MTTRTSPIAHIVVNEGGVSHNIAIELRPGVIFGNPDEYEGLAKDIAAGLLDAYRTNPPQARA